MVHCVYSRCREWEWVEIGMEVIGKNGNAVLEWEWMGMGMIRWECEGIGNKKVILHTSSV